MNKDELLKIYSAYLPYGLKGRTIYNLDDDESNEDCTLALKDGLNNVVGIDDWVNQYSYPIKPILYDLSYLTKEIEHEGKTIIPIVELAKIVSFYEIEHIEGYSTSGYDTVIYFKDSKGFYRGLDIVISPEGYLQFSFYTRNGSFASDFNHLRIDHIRVTDKLLEWHFNIFSLPESEYINKATLTNK